jgi:hypothetical protein
MSDALFSKFCKGTHSAGESGCNNPKCKGIDLCVAGCATCPDFVAAWNGAMNDCCKGQHAVSGGCENEGCRGLALCAADCVGCPDFIERHGHQHASSRGGVGGVIGDDSKQWWSRSGSRIKLYMACLAGPADPATRNDISLMRGLQEKFDVPQENMWLLLENQVSLASVHATIGDLAASCTAADVAVVYIGGHGSAASQDHDYRLESYRGRAEGEVIAAKLWACPCPLFVIIDSCHSAAFINDAVATAKAKNARVVCPEMVILASTQADNEAQTGWRIVAALHDAWLRGDDAKAPTQVATSVAATLRTGNERQRAQWAHIVGGELVSSTLH